jgi:hypothetical protein
MGLLRSVSPGRRSSHAARRAFWLAVALVLPRGAQNTPPPHETLQPPIGQRAGDSINGLGPGDPTEQEERLRALNRERQKSLVSDTNKLLKLATQFDTEVKGADSGALTPSQMHKLGEIEKLARNVKDKMSYSVRGPAFAPPIGPYRNQ